MAEKLSMEEYAQREAMLGVIPVLTKQRVYSLIDLMLVAGAFAIATWCYTQGAVVASMVTMPQSIGSVSIIVFAVPLVALIGVMSNKYGIDHFLCARAAWGFIGAAITVPIAMSVFSGWLTVNSTLYASSFSTLLGSVGMESAQSTVGIKLIGLTCPIIGFFIAIRGVTAVKWATRIMGACLVGIGILVLVLLFARGNASEMWNAGPVGGGETSHMNYMLTMEWNVSFVLAWYPCIGAITRITRNQTSSMWGLWFGYGVLMCVYIFIGVATAFAAVSMGASASGDPTEYLMTIGGPWLGSLSLVLIGFANITTAAVGVYSMSVSTKLLFPTLRYEWVALFYTALVCGLWLWGGIMTYYTTFLAYGAIVCGAGVTLLVVDYWILRRQRLDLHSLYEPGKKGAYWYTGGFNLAGVIAFVCGAVAYLAVYNPITYTPRVASVFEIFTASGVLVLVTGSVYLLLSLIPGVKRYMRADADAKHVC